METTCHILFVCFHPNIFSVPILDCEEKCVKNGRLKKQLIHHRTSNLKATTAEYLHANI